MTFKQKEAGIGVGKVLKTSVASIRSIPLRQISPLQQCDQMATWFGQYLAIYKIKFCPINIKIFCQNKLKKLPTTI